MTNADHEYQILSELSGNNQISQRVLSRRIGVSLGTINALLTKMAHDGKIKIEQTTNKQAMYLITPKGLLEKSQKTISYLKIHYRAIYNAKEDIKLIIKNAVECSDTVYLLRQDGELGQIVDVAINEVTHSKMPIIIYNLDEITSFDQANTIINATENDISDKTKLKAKIINVF